MTPIKRVLRKETLTLIKTTEQETANRMSSTKVNNTIMQVVAMSAGMELVCYFRYWQVKWGRLKYAFSIQSHSTYCT
jgi:hypothetical protein